MESRGLVSLSERRLLARGVPVRPLVYEAHPYLALLAPVLISDVGLLVRARAGKAQVRMWAEIDPTVDLGKRGRFADWVLARIDEAPSCQRWLRLDELSADDERSIQWVDFAELLT
ncbi:hypothetical protein SAMN05660464_4071 [Geodermatophilus dictyosporus]|uniref:Uncharacterized protein n=1 Tax=Geodermatophilus dictyosporus TaxID=1523247 RepID=A0A1I5SUQ8_9ACTN|nr:hypothetical protein [Geodermatophilus dictyosporus]SFP74490.1 hypothetical protein SAMN05660464_4071 [Geodermatophilus dictyosporus]